jgi:hypothetical protein
MKSFPIRPPNAAERLRFRLRAGIAANTAKLPEAVAQDLKGPLACVYSITLSARASNAAGTAMSQQQLKAQA